MSKVIALKNHKNVTKQTTRLTNSVPVALEFQMCFLYEVCVRREEHFSKRKQNSVPLCVGTFLLFGAGNRKVTRTEMYIPMSAHAVPC